jgi:very-short-patch-repair endonuclease
MAAVLACGDSAALSHGSASALLDIGTERGAIEVSVLYPADAEHDGIRVHRRKRMPSVGVCTHIPVLAPVEVLVDLAPSLTRDGLEAAINAADRTDLIDPEAIRSELDRMSPRPGTRILRETLDRRTFVFTDSTLERRYLPLSDRAGLPRPQTQRYLGSYRVDFIYDFGLVVETDGLRYHRTAAQQTRDLERSQVHTANGLVPLRFSHAQIRWDADHVVRILAATAAQLRG